MKTKNLILTILMLACTLPAFCRPANAAKESKRIINQNYKISDKTTQVKVHNKYGNITIVEWEKEEIDFSIEIIGKGENTKIAEEMAARISIDFNQSGNSISATTLFSAKDYKCNNCGTTINYTIRVPNTVSFDLTNKYGNVDLRLPELSNDFKADIKYGNITTMNLAGQNNTITLKYGNITSQAVNKLRLDFGYSNANLKSAEDLSINSAYCNVKIGEVNTLNLSSKYDKFAIGTLKNISVSAAYTNFDISKVNSNFYVSELKYGKIQISKLSPDFQTLEISATYTPVYISGISNDQNFNFTADLYTRYGKINTSSLTWTSAQWGDEEQFSRQFKGTIGQNPKASIKIKTTYADIILKK